MLAWAIRLFCRIPIEVSNASEVARHRQSIVVSNHHSLFDTPLIFLSLPGGRRRFTATVGGLDFFAVRPEQPWFERLFRRVVIWFIRSAMNVLLIDRVGGEYSQLDRIDSMLGAGWSLVIFPEATRSRSGEMGRFRHGAAELARRHRLPVVPAHVSGTDRILPPGIRWPRSGRLQVVFGEALVPEPEESSASLTARLRDAISRLDPRSDSEAGVAPVVTSEGAS